MQLSQIEREYLARIKAFMCENLYAKDDTSPHQMNDILVVTKEYGGSVRQEVSERVIDDTRWLVLYLMHCRHCSRPIDMVLAGNLIDNLGGFWLG